MKNLESHTSILGSQWRRAALEACGAFDPLTGMRIVPADPFVCFADGDDDPEGGDGGDNTPGKTFTQADVDRIVKQRLKKAERDQAVAAKRAEDAEKQIADLTKKFDTLQERYDASNKSDVEKELGKLQRQIAQMEERQKSLQVERDEAVSKATNAEQGLTKTRLEGTLRESLRTNKAHGKGMDQAVRLMLAEGATFDEEGNFTFKIGDVPYDKPEEATKKWLESNPHFMEGSGGGSGTPRAGNGKILTTEQMDSMETSSLLSVGLKSKPGMSPG